MDLDADERVVNDVRIAPLASVEVELVLGRR